MLLQRQGPGRRTHHQRQYGPPARRSGIAECLQPIPQVVCPLQQGNPLRFQQRQTPQGRQGRGRQTWCEGRGVAVAAAKLQQVVPEDPVHRHHRAAAAQGLAEGAHHHLHVGLAPRQAATLLAQHPQGVGFVQHQQRPVAVAEVGQSRNIRTGGFHAEQAFTHHQQPSIGLFPAGFAEAPLQILQVVVGKTLQHGATGANTHQQGVVAETIGQHQAVAVGQGRDGGHVGLEAAGKQQHLFPPQPPAQLLTQGLVNRPQARDQRRSAGPSPRFNRLNLGLGQAEVVVAAEIHKPWTTGFNTQPQFRLACNSSEAAFLPPQLPGQPCQCVPGKGEGVVISTHHQRNRPQVRWP